VNAIAVGPDTKPFHIYANSDITCTPTFSINKTRRSLIIEKYDNKCGMHSVSYGLTVTAKYTDNKSELRTGDNQPYNLCVEIYWWIFHNWYFSLSEWIYVNVKTEIIVLAEPEYSPNRSGHIGELVWKTEGA
jgi:hypothetical protein